MILFMKRFIYLLFIFFGILFISCKEKINEEEVTNLNSPDSDISETLDKTPSIVDVTPIKTTNNEHEHIFVSGKCTICDYECHHDYDNGKCLICDSLCSHEFIGGVCIICKYICPHEEFINKKCALCEVEQYEVCNHYFSNGVCQICEYSCPHINIDDGYCMDCGSVLFLTCKHIFVDEVCTICNYHCYHRHYNNSCCVLCGKECFHEGVGCLETCGVCGTLIEHDFKNGKCSKCGAMYELEAKAIPSKYLDTSCPNKGTVEKVVFQSYNYATNVPYENTFFVYLPYGYYSSNKEYNVMYLLHGSGENSAYWLAQLSYQGGYTETTKVLLDNMHYYHLCEETIVVTPTSNLNGTANFYVELLNNIMPLAETLYRTKAHLYGKNVKEVKNSDFISSRDYRAYAGLSRGSMIGWSILAYDLPYFGYYGFYSGGSYGLTDYFNDAKKNVASSNYLVKFAYHSCGDQDAMYSNHRSDYLGLLSASNGKIYEGKNTEFLTKPGFGHTYSSWIIDLYNSLGLRFFKY